MTAAEPRKSDEADAAEEVLKRLAENGPSPVYELAVDTRLPLSSLRNVLGKLQSRGIVELEDDRVSLHRRRRYFGGSKLGGTFHVRTPVFRSEGRSSEALEAELEAVIDSL